MKLINLFNKIVNGEKVPKKVKYDGKLWEYDKNTQDYINTNDEIYIKYLFQEILSGFTATKKLLLYEVEIIEEEKEIEEFKTNYTCSELDLEMIDKINELVNYVKKLKESKL